MKQPVLHTLVDLLIAQIAEEFKLREPDLNSASYLTPDTELFVFLAASSLHIADPGLFGVDLHDLLV